MRINALLPDNIITELDAIGEEENKSRSRLLTEAAEVLIKERQIKAMERERKARVGRALSIQDRLREKSGKWDGVSEVRKGREIKK